MKKIAVFLLLALFVTSGPLERGIALYLLGERKAAGAEWNRYFGKRKDVIAEGFRALAKGEYLSASYYFNSYRKKRRWAYYGVDEWLKYLGLSLAVKDIAPYHREWYVARAKILNPDNPVIDFTAGVYALEMGQLKKARKKLTTSLRKLKGWMFEIFMVKLLLEEGNLEKALEEAPKFLPRYPKLASLLVDELVERGDYERAWQMASQLPTSGKFLSLKIELALKTGKIKQAEELVYLFPESSPEREKFRALILVARGKAKKARKILEKLSEVLPSDPLIWENLYKIEKKEEKKRLYAYLAFFNGADIENIYGVDKIRIRKVNRLKWINENQLAFLGIPERGDEFGLYILDLPSRRFDKIPLRLEVVDFLTNREGRELLIIAVNRAKAKRYFFIYDLSSSKLHKIATLSLTRDPYTGWFNDRFVIMFSKEYSYLPFQSPFKRMVGAGRYVSFYSTSIKHTFVLYDREKKRLRVVRSLRKLPLLPPALQRYNEILTAYRTVPQVRQIIDTYSSAVQGDVQIDFDESGKVALFKRKVGRWFMVLGYLRHGHWIPLSFREDKKPLFLFKWMPKASAFLLFQERKDEFRCRLYIEGKEEYYKIEDNSTKAEAFMGQIYFLAFKRKTGGKGRLYVFDPQEEDYKKLTNYLWIDIERVGRLLLLKDFRTVVYRFADRRAVPVFVANDYDIAYSPSKKKVALCHPARKWLFFARLR